MKEQRQRLAKLKETENAIATLEAKLAELSRSLEKPYNPEEVRRLGREYESTQQQMVAKLAEWESWSDVATAAHG